MPYVAAIHCITGGVAANQAVVALVLSVHGNLTKLPTAAKLPSGIVTATVGGYPVGKYQRRTTLELGTYAVGIIITVSFIIIKTVIHGASKSAIHHIDIRRIIT